ncbi:hypothetical protein I3843_Q027300, partial [Carya illinoinensis]
NISSNKWVVDNMVRDGDHLILVNVCPKGNYEEGEIHDFSNPIIMKKYGVKRDPETLDIGDARKKICEAIDKIPLTCLVIGNRGLGKLKRAILGSASNYVVNNGSCPVTVVKQVEHEH